MNFPADFNGVQVKICGLTNEEDALRAIDLGADALGFNFYPPSPRAIDPARDLTWIARLPTAVQKVAVTVNADAALLARLAGSETFDLLQLHGDEGADYCDDLRARGIPFVKAIRVRDESSLGETASFGCPAILLDAYRPGAFGGTGHRLDWELARRFVAESGCRVILSGGLSPGNVAAAIAQVHPAGVDVASGVERPGEPRRKDAGLMRAFISAAHEAARAPAQS